MSSSQFGFALSVALSGLLGHGFAQERANVGETKIGALATTVEKELEAAWKGTDDNVRYPQYFATESLRRMRDKMTVAEVDAMSQLADRFVCQLFAFQTAKDRFPEHRHYTAACVALTTRRPAVSLMADVYKDLGSLDKGVLDKATLEGIERIPVTSLSNSCGFRACLGSRCPWMVV